MFNVPVSCLVLRHLYFVSFFPVYHPLYHLSIIYHLSIYLSIICLCIYLSSVCYFMYKVNVPDFRTDYVVYILHSS